MRRLPLMLAIALGGVAASGVANAADENAVVLPTAKASADAQGRVSLAPPADSDETRSALAARKLDGVLREAVQDLGLVLDVSERPVWRDDDRAGNALVARAKSDWVVSARLRPRGSRYELEILAIAPGSKVVMSRSEQVDDDELELRAMVMLRDLVEAGRGAGRGEPERDGRIPAPIEAPPSRSSGRAVLGLNAALLGGYIGFSLQRASSSDSDDDKRLVYPLVALGAGVGLGASMIVADEWDVGLGDAWFLSAAAWWPTAAGLALADGYGAKPAEDRYVYGLLGAAAGLSLGTTALTFRGMGEGGALLTHSGGAFGVLLGGATQYFVEGTTEGTPSRGVGYGAAIGVVGAGALATQFQPSPSRVLFIDLGATIGALGGAAAASPFVLDSPTPGQNRAFVGSVFLGTVVGGGVGWFATRSVDSAQQPSEPRRAQAPRVAPEGGVIGLSQAVVGRPAPIYGVGLRGTW